MMPTIIIGAMGNRIENTTAVMTDISDEQLSWVGELLENYLQIHHNRCTLNKTQMIMYFK